MRRRSESGVVAAEAALVAPVLIMMALAVVAFGRDARAQAQVAEAAADAARAASLTRMAVAAPRAAAALARAELRGCDEVVVDTDTSAFRPGGTVAVEVRCTVDLSDLVGLALPGRRTIVIRHVESVDAYRGGP